MSEEQSQNLIEKMLLADVREKRARRRWGIFFKLLAFSYIGFLIYAHYADESPLPTEMPGIGGPHVALIKIEGIIGLDRVEAGEINHLLRRAFNSENAKAIVLEINSPGGSAVQSHRIYKEIRRLREANPNKPVYAVAGDICASGGYFIAAAADRIFVDDASIVGSIGVIYSTFGFTEMMEKIGVERRVQTGGRNKNMFDPFSPQSPSHTARIQNLVDDTHRLFIDAVKEGRAGRLDESAHDLFSGLVWSGGESVRLGLADEIGDADYVAREIVGVDEVREYQPEVDFLDRFARGIGASLGSQATGALSPGVR